MFPTRGSTPHHQQVSGAPSNIFPNLAQIQPQMGFISPQLSTPFNNSNSNNGFINPQLSNPFNTNSNTGSNNSNGFNSNMSNGVRPLLGSFQPGFCLPNFGQNSGFMGNGQMGNMGQNMIPGNGQFGGWQNQGQNMNHLASVMLNPVQVAALSQLMGCVNQVAQGMIPQNGGFLGNPQLGLVQPNGGVHQQGNFGQQRPTGSQPLQNVPQLGLVQPAGSVQQQGSFGQQRPVGSQQLQNVPGSPFAAMPFNPALAQLQNNQSQSLQNQGSHGKKQGANFSNGRHNQNKNFTKNPRREASNFRSPNSKIPQMNNQGKGVKSTDPDNSSTQTNSGNRKPLYLLYTDKEIQKWREERKKNYPTKENFQKKLSQKQANADAAAEDAKLRRQQLKEVLAKQAELGLDVPEIPAHYLDNEDLSHLKGNKRPLNNGRHKDKFNKRGRFDKKNRFHSKKRFGDNDSRGENEHFSTKRNEENKNGSATPVGEPTLLQKLLSADIKRDNNRLLQAFRFMVMNSFFNEKTDGPLNFPTVIVEERVEGDDKESLSKELSGGIEVCGGAEEEGEVTG